MENFPTTDEQKELSIETIDGLEEFLKYSKEVFEVLNQLCEQYGESNNGKIIARLDEAIETEMALETLIKRNIRLLELGGEISASSVEEMQTLYNEIVEVRDDFIEGAEKVGVVEEVFNEEVIGESAATFSPEKVAALKDDVDEVFDSAQEITKKIEIALLQYEAASTHQTPEGEFNTLAFMYNQLGQLLSRAKSLANKVQQFKNTNVWQNNEVVVQHFTDEIEEVEKNFEHLITGIENFFEPEDDEDFLPKTTSGKIGVSEAEYEYEAANDNDISGFERENRLERLRSSEREIKTEVTPYIKLALANLRYRQFVAEEFDSMAELEAMFRREINEIEKPARLDKILGIARKSAFTLLKDMTIKEVKEFDTKSTEEIKKILTENDIDHNVYTNWLNDFRVMVRLIDAPPTMTFGELYVRSKLDVLLHRYQQAEAA